MLSAAAAAGVSHYIALSVVGSDRIRDSGYLRAKGVQEGLIEVLYKGVCVGNYRYDLLVEGRVLVEVKSGDALPPSAKRQLLNYLRGTGIEVGLLLHFGPAPRFLRCVHQSFID